MKRVVLLTVAAFAALHTTPGQALVGDVRDFREQQYEAGQRAGCQLRFADAVTDQDLDAALAISDECAALEQRLAD